jgi:hypothetical protein
MNRNAAAATLIVVVHHIVSILHGEAHERLGVGLAPWQWAYVYSVITIAPVVAVVLYWTRWRQWGALLLGISMLGALVFGVIFHFIHESNDHVSHLPTGDAQTLFVATAIALVPIEALAAGFGFWTWIKYRRLAPPDA